MKRYAARLTVVFFALAVMTVLTGCGSTAVNKKHILIETDAKKSYAKVFFIRPFTYRERGIADNPVKIELNRKQLISLGKGEYTAVHLKPVDATITTRSFSMFTNKLLPIEMTRSATMNFSEGQTYFIHIKQVNEEFRGVYYLPELIGAKTAKRMIESLRAIGDASSADFKNI